MEIKRRYVLKKKELKQIKEELNNIIDTEDVFDKKSILEKIITNEMDLIVLNGTPIAICKDNKIIPTLKLLITKESEKGKVTVDKGAVKFLANGADVMAPGIIDANPDIEEGNLVYTVEETHGKPLSVGIALMDGKTMVESKKGKAIITLHYIGDEIWKF
jgi:PUA domain protein